MSRIASEKLARCLADIEAGRATLEDCLVAYPEESAELRGLLQTAQALRSLPSVSPSEVFRREGRLALLQTISTDRSWAPQSALQRFIDSIVGGWQLLPRLVCGRMGTYPLIIALVISLTAATGGGIVLASQDTLPDEALYQVKTTLEGIQLSLVTSDEAKAQAYLALAANRLAEIQRANQLGRSDAARAATEALDQHLTQAVQHIELALAAGRDVSALEALLQGLERQQAGLATAKGQLDPAAAEALEQSSETASEGLNFAISRVQQTSPSDQQDDMLVVPSTKAPLPAENTMAQPASVPPVATPTPTRTGNGNGLDIDVQVTALVGAARSGNPDAFRKAVDDFAASIDSELDSLERTEPPDQQVRAEQLKEALSRVHEILGLLEQDDHDMPEGATQALMQVLGIMEQRLPRGQAEGKPELVPASDDEADEPGPPATLPVKLPLGLPSEVLGNVLESVPASDQAADLANEPGSPDTIPAEQPLGTPSENPDSALQSVPASDQADEPGPPDTIPAEPPSELPSEEQGNVPESVPASDNEAADQADQSGQPESIPVELPLGLPSEVLGNVLESVPASDQAADQADQSGQPLAPPED